mgnify:CR=1 FL=1
MFNMINFNYFLNIQEDTAMKQDKNSSIDTPLKNRLDWVTTIIPFVTILALCWKLLSAPWTGRLNLLPVHGIFPLWQNKAWES